MGVPYPGYPMAAPPVPPAPPRKGRTALIVVGSIAAVLVVCVVAAGALFAFVPQLRDSLTSASSTPTATASAPTATATPSEAILYQNTFATSASDWGNDANCFFGAGGYHVKDGFVCYAPVGTQTNVDVTVDVKQISGANNNVYGIALRLNRTTHTDYEMDMDALGHWVFYRCGASTCDRLIDFSSAASIHAGLNVVNTLEVRAKGAHFDFWINGAKVGQFDDSTYASGLVGLACSDNTECVFSNLTIAQPN